MLAKSSWTNPSEQLKRIERISRRTRHHQINLNKIYDEKLHQNLNNLFNEYEQTCKRLKTDEKLERQRKKLLDITINHITNERQRNSISANTKQIEQKQFQTFLKDNESLQHRPTSPMKLPSTEVPCRFFPQKCQLYPCQPVYQYTSFMKKEHDQTLQQRNSSNENSDVDSFSSSFQDLFTNIQNKKYQPNRRQLALTIDNQYRLANRHNSIKRTKTSLDEQSRLLYERLTEKKNFTFTNNSQHNLKQAIQRHLRISAKFCA
ncbi:unnamed protein product [Rotaria sp. Silwood1]|nr:unnamed protein product [Rotaria sp. Silwood1]CAF1542152.1 unnamed protein product [Rotaria sp. Silwood1]CAF3615453.1 unnamed protein product [Rotaria sp. Silwood1]CAF3814746.1 unnamed protein product [Rotaria sp. Silwood1]CAF5029088.1 unnamed protein product [Rotaria sp. Silwood1]